MSSADDFEHQAEQPDDGATPDGQEPSSYSDDIDQQSVHAVDRLLRQVFKKEEQPADSETPSANDELSWIEQLLVAELPKRFVVLGRLGSGTFGVVFRARDNRLGREIALKVLRPEWLQSKTHLARFLRESRVASRLNHTHIVRVLEAGETDKVAWQAMDIVIGDSLDAHIGHGRLDTLSVVRLIAQLADALDYAHRGGVTHRDIKPANILLNCRVNENLSNASALLTDFGLARISDVQQQSAPEGSSGLVGTPQYMAPEILQHGVSASSPQSDIYSLGVVLVEAIYGQNPFAGSQGWGDRYRQAVQLQHSYRQVSSTITKDLLAVCQKSLAELPTDRYSSAGVLADDLQCVLHGRPVSARGISLLEKSWRISKQNPALSGLTFGFIVCLLMIIVLAIRSSQDAHRQNKKLVELNARLVTEQQRTQSLATTAESLKDQALAERIRFAELALDSSIASAYRSYELTRVEESLQILDDLRLSQPEASQQFVWRLLRSRIQSEFAKVATFPHSATEVRRIPNTNLLAIAFGSEIAVVDALSGKIKHQFSTDISTIHALAAHPSMPWLYLGGTTHKKNDVAELKQVNWETGEPLRVLDCFPTTLESVSISPDGKSLLAGARYESPRCYQLDAQAQRTLQGNRKNTWLGHIPANDAVFYQMDSETIGVSSGVSQTPIKQFKFDTLLDGGYIKTATVIGNGPMIAVANQLGKIYLLNSQIGSVLGTLNGSKKVSVLVSNQAGTLIAAGTEGGEISVWKLPSSMLAPEHGEPHTASDTQDSIVILTQPAKASAPIERFRSWQLKPAYVTSLCFCDDRLACSTDSGDLSIINLEAGSFAVEPSSSWGENISSLVWETNSDVNAELFVLRNRNGSVYGIHSSQVRPQTQVVNSMSTFVSGSGFSRLSPLLDAEAELGSSSSTHSIKGFAVSPDGNCIAWPVDNMHFAIHKRSNGETITLERSLSPGIKPEAMNVLSLSHDASMLAIGTEKYDLCLASTTIDNHSIAKFELTGKPFCTCWSENGRRLYAAGNFDSIAECDLDTGHVNMIASVHTSTSTIRLTKDEKYVISGHTDGSIRIVSLESGETHKMLVHADPIYSLVLDRSERIGLSVDANGEVVAWNLELKQRLGTIWNSTRDSQATTQFFSTLVLPPENDCLWLIQPGVEGPSMRWLDVH